MKTLASVIILLIVPLFLNSCFLKGGATTKTNPPSTVNTDWINFSVTSNPPYSADRTLFQNSAVVTGVKNFSAGPVRVTHTDIHNVTVTVDIAPQATAPNFNGQKMAGYWQAIPLSVPTPETTTLAVNWR